MKSIRSTDLHRIRRSTTYAWGKCGTVATKSMAESPTERMRGLPLVMGMAETRDIETTSIRDDELHILRSIS